MDLETAIVGVSLSGEERFQLPACDLSLERAQRRLGLCHDLAVVLGFRKLDQGEIVVELALDAADRAELILERGTLLHQPLCALIVVPEVGVFGELVQLGKPTSRIVDVKDASSAVRWTA
jgi:hypothetical protein